MPTDMMKKVENKCDYSMSELEKKWNEAEAQAEKQDQGDNYGYITSIFKKMLNDKCLEKLGWKKNENKEEYNMSKTDELLEKIDLYLISEGDPHGTDDVEWDEVRKAVVDASRNIYNEVSKEFIDGIMKNLYKHKPNDTENAIAIGIDMLRAEE